MEILDSVGYDTRTQISLVPIEVAVFDRRYIPWRDIRALVRSAANPRCVRNFDAGGVLLCRHCERDTFRLGERR